MNAICPKCAKKSVSPPAVAGLVKCGHCEEWFEAPLSEEVPRQASASQRTVIVMPCPACLRPVSSQANACPHCGQPFSAVESRDDFAGKIIIVVLIVGAAIWFLASTLHKMNEEKRQAERISDELYHSK